MVASSAAFAAGSVTVQGVLRNSANQPYTYSATNVKIRFKGPAPCAAGCDEATGQTVDIVNGAFSVSLTPATALAPMVANPVGWTVEVEGVMSSGAPSATFAIPLSSMPFAVNAEQALVAGTATTANSLAASIAAGDSAIAAINMSSNTINAANVAAGLTPAQVSGVGTFATAQIPNLDAGKITTGTMAIARLPAMGGATAMSNGTAGMVPQPNAGQENLFLRGDGTWASAGGGSVTNVTATLPLTSSGGATPDISMPAAATAQSGYLTSADWNTFSGKQSALPASTGGVYFGTGAAGGVGADATNLFWNNASKRLGIGTATPDTALHVVGALKMVDGNQAADKVLRSDAAGVASWVTLGSLGDTRYMQLSGGSFTGPVTMATQNELRLGDNDGTPNYVALRAESAMGANYTLNLPAGAPAVGKVLKVTAAAAPVYTLSWEDDATGAGSVPSSRTITAGTGLTGGGDLSADRTLAVDFGDGVNKVVAGDNPRVPTLTGNGDKFMRINAGGTALTYRTAAEVLADIGAAPTSHTHTKSQITDLEAISATPGNNTIVKSDGAGKIADGWLSSNVSLLGTSIDLASEVGTSILPVANGGTGASSFTANSVIFSDGTNLVQDNANLAFNDASNTLTATNVAVTTLRIGTSATANYVLKTDASGNASWADVSTLIGGPYLPISGGTLTGDLVVSNDKFIALGTRSAATASVPGQIWYEGGNIMYRDATGPKTLATTAGGGGTVTGITAGTGLTGGTINSSGTIAVDFGTSGAGKVVEANDARLPAFTGNASKFVRVNSTPNALEYRTAAEVLADIGAAPTSHTHTKSQITDLEAISATPGNNTIVKSDGAGKIADGWLSSNVSLLGTSIDLASEVGTSVLPVANGGTGAATLTGVVMGNGTGAMTGLAASAASQVLRRNATNSAYEFAVLTAADVGALTTAAGDARYLQLTGGTLTGDVLVDNQKEVRLGEVDANGANYVALRAPADLTSGNYVLTLPAVGPAPGEAMRLNAVGTALEWFTPAAGGEANTAANVGTGVGKVYRDKTGVQLNFKSIAAGSTKLSVSNGADDVTLDVAEANLSHANIGGIVPIAKGGTGVDLSATGGAGQVLKQASAGANITVGTLSAADVGAAAASHTHNASDINAGTLPVLRGGTGASSFTANSVIFSDGTNLVQDNANLAFNDTSNTLSVANVTVGTALSTAAFTMTGGSPAADKILRSDASGVASWVTLGSLGDTRYLQLTGGTLTGDLLLGDDTFLRLGKHTGAAEPNTAGWNATQAGRIWYDDNSNTIKYWNGSGPQELGVSGAGLTSVGLSLPAAIFDVTGSPLTANGSISVALDSQTQNHVFAAPVGSNGAPTFRALAAADLPATTSFLGGDIDLASAEVTGILPTTKGGTGRNIDPTTIADGELLIGNAASDNYARATLTQAANQGVTIVNAGGGITLGTAQDIRTSAAPTFTNARLSNYTTDGSILFTSGGNGTMAADATNFSFNNTTDTLTAKNMVVSTQLTIPTGASNNYVLKSDGSGNASWADISSLVSGVSGSGTAGRLPKFTAGTALGDSLVFDDGTNIGIGAASTGQLLHVHGTARVDTNYMYAGALELGEFGTGNRNAYLDFHSDDTYTDWAVRIIRNSGPNGTLQYAHRGTGTVFFQNNEAAPFAFTTSGQTRLQIDAGGNVGVGDSSPASLFTVGNGDKFQVDANGNIIKLNNVTTSFPAANAAGVLTNDGNGALSWASPAPAGEVNTASNVGSGASLFKQKTGVNLEFKSLTAGSSKVSFFSNANDVAIDVVEANLSHANIGGIVPIAKGGTGVDLSATGGAGQVLKQASAGANITVGTLSAADVGAAAVSHTHTKSQITDLETITATPTASAVPKADGSNKLADGWLSSNVSLLGNTIDLTSEVTGTLPVANGGTGTSTAFTQGSIVFAGASGVYAQDNANFFWDDSNNRLGIGTSPSYPLHVNGPTSDGYAAVFQRGLKNGHAVGTFIGSFGGNATIQADENTVGPTNLVIQPNGGSTSIGTTNTAAKLAVQLNSTATGPSYFNAAESQLNLISDTNTVGAGPKIMFNTVNNGNATAGIGMLRETAGDSAASLIFSTRAPANGAVDERMRITSGGSVGFGMTPSATYRVDVSGKLNATELCIAGTCQTAWPGGLGGSGTANYMPKFTAGTTLGNSLIYDDGSGIGIGNAGAGGYRLYLNATSNNIVNFRSGLDSGVNFSLKYQDTPNSFEFDTGSATISTSFMSGNVGVGTNNPDRRLQVAFSTTSTSTDAPIINVRNTNTSGASLAQITAESDNGAVVGQISTTGATAIGTQTARNVGIRAVATSGNADLGLFTTNAGTLSEKMRILPGGNVGIGITNPGTLLHVKGVAPALTVDRTVNTDTASLTLSNNGTPAGYFGLSRNDGSGFFSNGTANSVAIYSLADTQIGTSGTAYMTLKNGGNVGIGTNNPSYRLHTTGGDVHLVGTQGTISTAALAPYSATGVQLIAAAAKPNAIVQLGTTNDTGSVFAVYDNAVNSRFWVQANGNAAFGAPGTKGLYFTTGWTGYASGAGDADAEISNDTGSYQGLMLVGNGVAGIRRVLVYDNLIVSSGSYAGAFYYNSDRRLKHNIRLLDGEESLDKIMKIKPVSFDWNKSGRSDIGFVAQEIEEIFPTMVSTDDVNGMKSVQYGNLISPTIAAVQVLNNRQEEQRQDVGDLQRKVAAQEEEIKALRKAVFELQNKVQ